MRLPCVVLGRGGRCLVRILLLLFPFYAALGCVNRPRVRSLLSMLWESGLRTALFIMVWSMSMYVACVSRMASTFAFMIEGC